METYHSLKLLQQELKQEKYSLNSVVEHYLKQIEEQKQLNVFLDVYETEALAKADQLQMKLKDGKPLGKLFGLVIGIKDVLVHQNHEVRSASEILKGFESQFTGTAVQRLLDEDAIIIGAQNCDEFAMGSSNENSAFGPTLNAADHSRVPGGSSGASAVAVQAGLCMASLGTDTGGSVRQPAAFCGVVGIKPTYSRVSRYGLIAFASSFDCIGIFSNNIEDNARILEVIAGYDEYDSTVSTEEVPDYASNLHINKKLKIAYVKETIENEALNSEIKEATISKLEWLKKEGHQVEEVTFPHLDYVLPTYYILTTAEASTNLSRFDGVRYGYRAPEAHNMESMYKLSRSQGFGEEVKRRIMLGTFVLSASYFDAYYTKAQKVRRIIRDETREMLSEYDFIIMPTTPTTAFQLGTNRDNPAEMYLEDIFTVQANVSGIPAISIPNGVDAQNLPIGLQIMTDVFKEIELYAFADYLMQS
ncbi:glutamyl-tRNA(Gln) amidotransferase subunit A [Marivirga tractuosa]|uniref:Glutamyl-tRNA(Gln) amidotransferase subunit A n=1 Tax=Marivirga tractuosa (strain ATCC 23168 / DSM 4126 / NBRC 15989 / NCIMB 1408 / VKM B-1430 / H-43) TaxID=643867 RepID=E4TL29_MARTH|nr:Asp-tRNA(Asn)/Glu-tRNA(Gln) amidotransferase subunit GatA [Marivirga tractuosa]ADR23306.1 aspartyl/glutamyl-tRNA(Asn/Gln) amidotransferase subunit A [Marivirga tractuosa DSM 4126]BDD16020.1 glutamyl-tRNA(Gln) amidotransferase subunit A [Marivirga tractuosa]